MGESSEAAIKGGYMSSHIGDGTILAGYGGENAPEFSLTSSNIEHVGESLGNDVMTIYFIPIVMNTLGEEGYSKMRVTVSGSASGIPGADSSTPGGSGFVALCRDQGSGVTYIQSNNITSFTGLDESADVTVDLNFIDSGSFTPTYVTIKAWNGTLHIKKIWFE